MTATGHEYALNQRRFNSSIGPTAAISTTFRSTGFDPERATGIRSPLSFNGKHISRRRGLISTLSRLGRVNSKDRVVLCDALKRGHRRVVLDRQVVPTARGDLAPSLKDGRPLLW